MFIGWVDVADVARIQRHVTATEPTRSRPSPSGRGEVARPRTVPRPSAAHVLRTARHHAASTAPRGTSPSISIPKTLRPCAGCRRRDGRRRFSRDQRWCLAFDRHAPLMPTDQTYTQAGSAVQIEPSGVHGTRLCGRRSNIERRTDLSPARITQPFDVNYVCRRI